MKLLRFGDKVINMDHVTDIRLTGHLIYLYFGFTEPNSYSGEQTQVHVRLEGVDADAFRIWLLDNAENLVAPPPLFLPAPDDDIPF